MTGVRRFFISVASVLLFANLLAIAWFGSHGNLAGVVGFSLAGALAAFLMALWLYYDEENREEPHEDDRVTNVDDVAEWKRGRALRPRLVEKKK